LSYGREIGPNDHSPRADRTNRVKPATPHPTLPGFDTHVQFPSRRLWHADETITRSPRLDKQRDTPGFRWNSASSAYTKARRPARAWVFQKRRSSGVWPGLLPFDPDCASYPAWAVRDDSPIGRARYTSWRKTP